ncbi:hypothetical protein [Synechococcus sp. PCC 6312]|uniref:hypothetical protein n=1 Tax=Synechococcus sp. (strain ATCC 27167 / PCC 6312) TaxID=195253 RepID=UPI000307BE31|nr:hypothetical protein [Synechococcus sp. PCC 6312]
MPVAYPVGEDEYDNKTLEIEQILAGVVQNVIGRIAWSPEGEWDNSTPYQVDDIVYVPGVGSFICVQNHTNQQPPNPTYWQRLTSEGAKLLTGNGVPSSGLGRDGDLYIDVENSDLYGPKTSGAWGSGTSLIGAAGVIGSQIYAGTGAPSDLENDVDLYIDDSTGDLYKQIDGEWELLLSLKGEDGATGTVSAASGVTLEHIATPSAPSAGNTILYAKSDNKLYFRPASGSETEVGAGSGGASAFADLTDVDFDPVPAVGDTFVWNGLIMVPAYRRDVLTSDRDYYFRTDGNDSNTGATNDAMGAFLTPQKAIDVVAGLDISIQNVLIQGGDGDYTGAGDLVIKAPLGSGNVTLQGNTSDRSLVQLGSTTFTRSPYLGFSIKDLYLNLATNVTALAANAAYLTVNNCRVRNASASGFSAKIRADNGGTIIITNGIHLEGNTAGASGYCFFAFGQGLISALNQTFTMISSPSFGNVYYCGGLSFIELGGSTISGTYTGTLYTKEGGGTIRGPAFTYV